MLITDKVELEKYAADRRIWQGIPGVERTSKGRLFVSLYSGGTREQLGNYVLLLASDDNGATFADPVTVAVPDDTASMRYFDPGVWIDPLGRLWLWWSRCPQDAVQAVICDAPDADELIWSKEFTIGHNVMMNKPAVLFDGTWLFPTAVWDAVHDVRVLSSEYDDTSMLSGAYAVQSKDGGRTFLPLGCADVPLRHFDEHMVLQQRDGSLRMLVRTWYGIGQSFSSDGGRTWSPGEDSGLGGPCSRFHIRRLRSGRVLLINHVGTVGHTRNNLAALLSDDDGKTWPWQLLLDERNDVSYPDACEDEDGRLYVIYDRERGSFKSSWAEAADSAREILMACITENDILAGRLVNGESYLQRIVSKLGEYAGDADSFYLDQQ